MKRNFGTKRSVYVRQGYVLCALLQRRSWCPSRFRAHNRSLHSLYLRIERETNFPQVEDGHPLRARWRGPRPDGGRFDDRLQPEIHRRPRRRAGLGRTDWSVGRIPGYQLQRVDGVYRCSST